MRLGALGVGNCKALAARGTAAGQHLLAAGGSHAHTETVGFGALSAVRLKSSLRHDPCSFLKVGLASLTVTPDLRLENIYYSGKPSPIEAATSLCYGAGGGI